MPEYPWIIYRMSEGPLTTKEVHQGVNEQLNRKLGTDWGYSEYEWANLLQGFRPLPIRTASGTIAHFEDGADAVPMKSVVANIVPIQEGTGTPSPSNPRPISGTNELTLNHKGKNLFDSSLLVGDGITNEGGIVSGTAAKFNTNFGSGLIMSIPNSQMTISFKAKTDGESQTSDYGLAIGFIYTDGSKSAAYCPNNTFDFSSFSYTSSNLKQVDKI